MIDEEKRECFVDEWIEVRSGSSNKHYESLGYEKYRNEKGKLVYKIHPWDLSKGSTKKVNIKCPKCGEIRNVQFNNVYKAKISTCQKCFCRKKKIDLTGKRFGRLTVIKDSGKRQNSGNIVWACKCDCGNLIEIVGTSLTRGITKSCGCLAREKAKERLTKVKRDQGYFIRTDHTKEEIEEHLNKAKGRRIDFKWRNLSKKLRKNAKCEFCGSTTDLVVHHKNGYWQFPDQRYDEDNLVVLCNKCHSTMHNKIKEITEEAFNKYLEAV